MPEQRVPDNDPIVSKSYAAHYMIAMLILMVTLFWALWDESFGQRPWKAFQHEWKDRYTAFLNSARSKSSQSQKEVEQNSQYQQLEKAYKDAYETAKPRRDERPRREEARREDQREERRPRAEADAGDVGWNGPVPSFLMQGFAPQE